MEKPAEKPAEEPGIPFTDFFRQLEGSTAQREQPVLVRNMILNALGDETRRRLETEVDGGLSAALERGRIVYQWIPISNAFQLGLEINPDAIESGRRLIISIDDPTVNAKFVEIIKKEFPTAYRAIIERARQEWIAQSPAEMATPRIETVFSWPVAEIDEKVLSRRRFRLLMSIIERSPRARIRISLQEKWQDDKEPEIVVSYRMEKVADPNDKDKNAILVTEEVPITVYEKYKPDVPHQKQYFHSRQEPRTIRYYLHDDGEITYDEETIKKAAVGLTYRYAGFGVDTGTPEEHMNDIKGRSEIGWRVWMSLPRKQEIKNPTLDDLNEVHSIGEVVKRQFVIENVE